MQLLQKHLFDFDKADDEFTTIMSTWTYERALLIERIAAVKGERSGGSLSPPSLDMRYDAKIEALRQDMMRR